MTDNRGDQGFKSLDPVKVHYGFNGFRPPLPTSGPMQANAGRAIPVKWALTAPDGNAVTVLSAVASYGFDAPGATFTLSFDQSDRQYVLLAKDTEVLGGTDLDLDRDARRQERPHPGREVLNARRTGALILTVIAVGVVAGCGSTAGGAGPASGSGSPPSQPSATGHLTALAGIDPARLPAAESAIASVTAKLPAEVAGHALTSRTARKVTYADGTTFSVEPLAEAAPGWTMPRFFTRFVGSSEFTITAQNPAGAPLLWLVATGRPPYQVQFAVVAAASGAWLFAVDAASPAAAEDLVAGFTAALR